MGIHTGRAGVGDERYHGLGVHRAARIGAAAHGGQVLVSSSATRELVEEERRPGRRLRDLGEHRLKDLDRPERLYQLDIEGLADRVPAAQGRAGRGAAPAAATRVLLVGRSPA